MSFASREYEWAIKQGDYKYQRVILSNEIRRLRERERNIRRAEARAFKEGIDIKIVKYAYEDEHEENQKLIETLSKIREQTVNRIKAEQKGEKLPKVQTYKALQGLQKKSVQEEKMRKKPYSERNLSAQLKATINVAVAIVTISLV